MSSRRKARELALQLLFQEEVTAYPADQILELFWRTNRVDSETRGYAESLFTQYLSERNRIDTLISRQSKHWRLERMGSVDRNVLRMAVAELIATDTPDAVIVDEAIELAKKFGSEESGEFINGVLDGIRSTLEAEGSREEGMAR